MNDLKKTAYFCEQCGEVTAVVEDRKAGEVSCEACGMILAEHVVDQTSEWRTFSSDDNETNRIRVGGPVNPLLSGLAATVIGTKDFKGNNVKELEGLVRLQVSTALSSQDRSLVNAMGDIKTICGRLGFDDQAVFDLSCQIYKEIISRNLLRGRNSEAMKVVCVYISCRVEGLTRSIKEICENLGIEKKAFNRAFTFIKDKMGFKLEILSMERFVKRFCSSLEMSVQDTNAVGTVVETIGRNDLLSQGKNPVTIVAVSIYFISYLSGVKLDHKRISEVCRINEMTIKHAYSELYPSLSTLVPSNWTPKIPIGELPVPPAYRKE